MHALSVRGLTKTYKNGVQALQGHRPRRRAGRFLRAARPERRRQDHADRHRHLAGQQDRRHRRASSATTSTASSSAAKSCIGVVPQELNFNMFETPLTIVVNQAGFYGIPRAVARERAEKYLKQLQLWDKRNGMARALSGGMKRRLMIARALMHEPRLLILDEPTAGVDIEIRRSMWEFLREINAQRHHHHPDHALSRGGREPVPQHRHHRRRPHRRARPHEQPAAQAAHRDLRAQPARAGRGGAAAAGLSRSTLVDDHTLEVEMSQGAEPQRAVRAARRAQGIEVLSACATRSTGSRRCSCAWSSTSAAMR